MPTDLPAHGPSKVMLAYSGGLDTSAIVPWLGETYGCEVVAFVADVGQGPDELEGIEDKAVRSGASSCVVADLRADFVERFAFPALAAGAVYEGRYLLGTSTARPAIAEAQVRAAREHGADALCHGCTGKGNDQVRFESAFAALAPDLPVIAPWREWPMRSREDLLAYLAERGVATSASAEKLYSRDRNLWHISHEGGALEDPWNEPPDDIWMLTRDPRQAPGEPRDVTIGYERATPRTLDGVAMDGVQLVERLNVIAGEHGVGRIDLIENRLVGMKSRGCYETPAGTVLLEGLQGLRELVLDRASRAELERNAQSFAQLVYDGRWFTPVREAVWRSIRSLCEPLTGEVVVRLFKGSATTVRRRSEHALYDERFATFGADDVYDQRHAEGFIRLFSLPERINAIRRRERRGEHAPPPTAAGGVE